MNECVSLITSIFADRDEAEVFEYLSRDDAQTFIDVVDGVSNQEDGPVSPLKLPSSIG